MIFENNVVLGYSSPNYNSGQYPGLFCCGSGIAPVSGLTSDYAGNSRPNPPSIGALE